MIDPPPLVIVTSLPADASALLTPSERERHAAYPAQKRRDDWLLGRAAAKQALRALCRALGQPAPDYLAFSVESAASGAPRVAGLDPEPALSLTHGHGQAAAWARPAGPAGGLVGVDLERIKPRPGGTLRFYLHPHERAWLEALDPGRPKEVAPRDVAAIVCWALKEAAFKALQPPRGTGLLDVELEPTGDLTAARGAARIRYRGSAAERARQLGVGEVRGGWSTQGDLVTAWADAPGGRLPPLGEGEQGS